jgi:cysteine desulfurase
MSKRIFLDYASTTPLDPKVAKVMAPYFSKNFGNPSAIYKEGLVAKAAIKEAREDIARMLNVRPEEIIFTASGTEADNLAIIGIFNAFYKHQFTPHFITTTIEHPGVLEAFKCIEQQGAEVSYIKVDESGIVDPKHIAVALRPNTVLVSVMYANNEIGTIQPIRDIARVVRNYSNNNKTHYPYLHTDASQAANYLDLSFQKLGVDMMTLDASKIYGPKGIGLLAVKRNVDIKPIIFGGGQERGLRAGTENVPYIVGMAEALTIAQTMREKESLRLSKIREFFFNSVIKKYPSVLINGDRHNRLPNNVNICFPGIDAEFAVIKLDKAGISISSASSCMNLNENSYSYVVEALGQTGEKCRESSLRFTFGRATTQKEIELTLTHIQSIIIAQ